EGVEPDMAELGVRHLVHGASSLGVVVSRAEAGPAAFVRLLGSRSTCRVNAGIAPWILYFSGVFAGIGMTGDGDLSLRKWSERDDREAPGGAGRARAWILVSTGLLAALALAGCGTISDETAGRAAVAPGKYDVYACPNIEARIHSVQA